MCIARVCCLHILAVHLRGCTSCASCDSDFTKIFSKQVLIPIFQRNTVDRDGNGRLAFGRGQRNPRPQPFRIAPSDLKLHKIDGITLLRENERIKDVFVPMGGGEVDQAVQTATRAFRLFCITPSLLWGYAGQACQILFVSLLLLLLLLSFWVEKYTDVGRQTLSYDHLGNPVLSGIFLRREN